MARKNVFDIPSNSDTAVLPTRPTADQPKARPLLGLDRPIRQASPLGAISQSLDGINAKVKRAEQIEERLAAGQTVVELDPNLVDGSFVTDRMDATDEQHEQFLEQIRAHGQQTPILVRPNPSSPGRFEVAYGHRRLRAARDLGRAIRAIVRSLTDEELVVAQGQENSARTDLTFIERARFAARLESRNFNRETIMAALNVDKTVLSKLISIANRIPPDIVEAVGPAPAYGRVRWQELAELLDNEERHQQARHIVATPTFLTHTTDKRFELLHSGLKRPTTRRRLEPFILDDGTKLAHIVRTDQRLTLAFDNRAAADFGNFLTSRLQDLYNEYKSRTRDQA